MRDERQGHAGGLQLHLLRATQTELRRHGYQSVLLPHHGHSLRRLRGLVSLQCRCWKPICRGSARAAQVSSSRGDTHRLPWIGPSHSQACAPKRQCRSSDLRKRHASLKLVCRFLQSHDCAVQKPFGCKPIRKWHTEMVAWSILRLSKVAMLCRTFRCCRASWRQLICRTTI